MICVIHYKYMMVGVNILAWSTQIHMGLGSERFMDANQRGLEIGFHSTIQPSTGFLLQVAPCPTVMTRVEHTR